MLVGKGEPGTVEEADPEVESGFPRGAPGQAGGQEEDDG